jgi:HK97 family phage major capsid protein
MLVRDSLVQSCSQVIDTTFLSASAATSTVSPAGILNGLSSLGSNGYTADALRADIKELYAPFITAKYDLSGLTFVMHPSLAKAISLLANAFGQQEFPGMGANGGTLLGDRVVTGHNVGATTIILLDPRNIWRIGDMGIEVSMSDQATIEQDGAPAGDSEAPTAASATLMSMFGQDSVAFKVVRPINFQKRRSTAVTFISDAQYGDSTSTTA